jgi:hypothetical protein
MTEQQTQLKTNHSVRIVILSTGERVLCLFGDIKDDQDRIIGFKIFHPYILSLGPQDENGSLPIKYSKWCPYTPVNEFRLKGEHIITITYPDNFILDNYIDELQILGIPREKLFYNEETNGDNSELDEAGE